MVFFEVRKLKFFGFLSSVAFLQISVGFFFLENAIELCENER